MKKFKVITKGKNHGFDIDDVVVLREDSKDYWQGLKEYYKLNDTNFRQVLFDTDVVKL